MTNLNFNTSALDGFVKENEINEIKPFVETANDLLINGTGVSSEMRQWVELPQDYDKKEFADIKDAAQKIRKDSDVLVVIGIGGSYLGAKMAIDFLKGSYFNNLSKGKRNAPQIFFTGNSISGSDMSELIEMLDGQDFSINVISKSGTTTEPSIAFRIFRELLVKKYGEAEANQRTYVTTDANKGSLRKEVKENNFQSFVIPDGVGGRYSVLTPVGLLPIAVAGVNIDELMDGANQARINYQKASFEDNEALQYAAYRNVLYRKGYTNEIFENYEPSLRFLSEWLKQLTGETEGKDNKGIYPSSANFSTDLHSLGQYIQQGMRNLMETVVNIQKPEADQVVPNKDNNDDGIQYLEGRNLNYINEKARESVVLAHKEGGVPNMLINVEDQTPSSLGYLIYFFEYAIAVSGYLNGINPFNQPGVEDYKSNMFALLGKPGYEDLKKKLENKNN